jgi:antitoxin component HigA of HigAB toxin-antitoxin module
MPIENATPTPIELLQSELDKYQKALSKLEQAFKDDLIPEDVYHERRDNLLPKIYIYKVSIHALKDLE